ncbi:MAG TPA: kelch repeat-containing protein [Elusimicrobiota bacterium]|nr:kelch repeat-containing protein [Elusimicrobiota bacterium]
MHKNRLGALIAIGSAAGLWALPVRAQSTARYGNVSVLLPNGNILIAGGDTDNNGYVNATNEAEIFLPDGAFQTITPMNAKRVDATGTLLPDGTVLVAGGVDNTGTVQNTVEVYNPATGNWATSGASFMSARRFAHTATLLKTGAYAGDVLLCGGFSDTSYTANSSCDIYRPNATPGSIGSIAASPALLQARGDHTATLLTDGRVFVTGGYNPAASPPYLATSEVYTPGIGNSFQAAHYLNVERSSQTATLMGNGEVLITGGYNGVNINGSNGYLADTEIYNPTSDSMQPAAPMEELKAFHSATLMPDGAVQTFGGFGNIPYTQIPAQGVTLSGGDVTGSATSADYEFNGTVAQDSTTGGSVSFPLSIQLGAQASGIIQNGEIIFSTPSIVSGDGAVLAYFVPGSSNPLGGLYADLSGSQVTCSSGNCGVLNGTFNLSGLNQGYYQIQTLSVNGANASMSGAINFNSCDASNSPCNLTGGTLNGTMALTVPKEFVGYTIEAGSFTLTNGSINTSTSTLTLAYALGGIPTNTTITSDGKGNGVATFAVTFSSLTGQVTLQSGNSVVGPVTMPGTYFPTTDLQSIKGNLEAVFNGFDTTGASFSFGISTVVINEMFFGDNECYNPSQNQWAFCDRQNSAVFTGRYGQSATLLPDGNLVFLGGLTCTLGNCATPSSWSTISGLSAAETLNSSFSAGPSMGSARADFTATLLPSGKILVAGGKQGNAVLNQAELYDPSSNTFSPTSPMTAARDFQTATLLVNGNVLVAGGFTSNGTSTATTNTAEIYYPATGLWAPTSSMSAPRENATATLLPNGSVLVAGGYDSNTAQYLNTAEIYYSTSATWAQVPNTMTARRGADTATLLPNGKVLIVGGFSSGGPLKTAEIYDPASGTFSPTGSLPQNLYQHTATLLPDGKVLIAGGDTGSGESSAAYLYDPGAGTFSATGSLNVPRFNHTATLLPDGEVLVAGGYDSNTAQYLNSVEIYSEELQSWASLTTLNAARAYQAAILTPDGNVHVMGGSNGSSDLASTEVMYFTQTPDQESGTSTSLRQSSITAVTPSLFDRGAAGITVAGKNFEGDTEASGGGGGPLNSSFYAPRLVLDSLGSSGGSSSQGDSGFTIDLTTDIYSANGGVNTSWANMDSSITVASPATANSLPYGWYGVRTVSNAQYANATIVQAGPAKPTTAPTGLGNTVYTSSVVWNWSWSAGSGPSADGFDVYSATSGLFLSTVPAAAFSYTESNLAPSTTAQIIVAAYTLSGDGPASTSTVVYTPPAQPLSLTISSVTPNSVALTWNPNQNAAGTLYEISDSTDDFRNSFSTPVAIGDNLSTDTAIVSPLSPNTTYYFRVRAASLGGVFSNFSSAASTQTTIPVISVSGTPCAGDGTACIQWTWTSPGGSVNYYKVYNATAASVVIATPTVTSFTDINLSTNSVRAIQVSAVTSQGEGPLSAAATGYTLAAVPGAASPSIIVLDSGSFIGAWASNGNPGGTQYQMQVLIGGSVVASVSTPTLSASFGGISPAASIFSAQVAAFNQAGVLSSYRSLGSTATYAEAPSGLSVTGVGATSISLSWLTGGNSSSTTYQVSYSTDNFLTTNFTALPFSSGFSGNSYTLTGLSSTLLYYLRVQAQNPFGQTTAFSNTVSTEPFNGGAPTGTLGGILYPNESNVMQGLLPNGMNVTLNAPAGVVNSPVTIFISTMGFAVSPCPGSVNSTGLVVLTQPSFEPLAPYYLTISYSPASIPFSISQATLMRIDPSGTCVPLASAVDTAQDVINATVNHFSEFVIAQQVPGGAANDAKIFPNPFYPSRGNGYVTFSNMPADARVRIFTLHGELVFDENANSSGVLIWPGTNRAGRRVASGVYLAAVEGSGTRHIFKVVVIR